MSTGKKIVLQWDDDLIGRIDRIASRRHTARNDLIKEATRLLVEAVEHEEAKQAAELEALRKGAWINGNASRTTEALPPKRKG